MKGRRDFKTLTAAAAASLLIAAMLLAAVCVIPTVMIDKLYARTEPHIDAAVDLMLRGDVDGAAAETAEILRLVEEAKGGLHLFYDHNKVSELTGAAAAALKIVETGDAAQFIETLGEIETAFRFLIRINDLSIANIL